MKCPKCGKIMSKDFCMFCGYMLNGNYIRKKHYSASDLSKALGSEYDTVIRNENTGMIFLLGPLYFAYRNYFFLGFVLEFINLFSYFVLYIFHHFFRFNYSSEVPNVIFWIVLIFYFIINKFFWILFSNPIYVFFLKKKIKKIIKNHKDNKDDYIRNVKNRNIYKPIFAAIMLVIIPITIVIIIRWYFGNL